MHKSVHTLVHTFAQNSSAFYKMTERSLKLLQQKGYLPFCIWLLLSAGHLCNLPILFMWSPKFGNTFHDFVLIIKRHDYDVRIWSLQRKSQKWHHTETVSLQTLLFSIKLYGVKFQAPGYASWQPKRTFYILLRQYKISTVFPQKDRKNDSK